MRRLRRLGFAILLLGVFAVAVGITWLNSDDFQRRVGTLVETTIEQRSGEQLSVNRIDIELWPPSIHMTGFHLFHEPTGDSILRVANATVPLVLARGGVRIGSVWVDRPELLLHIDADGLREFRGGVAGSGPAKPLREIPIGGLRLVDARIRIEHRDGHIELNELHLTPTSGPVHRLAATLDVEQLAHRETVPLAWDGIEIRHDGITVPAVDIRSRAIDVTGSVDWSLKGALNGLLQVGVDLDALRDALKPPRELHGLVDAQVSVLGSAAHPLLRVEAVGKDLGYDAPGKRVPLVRYRLGDIDLRAHATPHRVDIERIDAKWAGGRVFGAGVIDPTRRVLTHGTARAEGLSLREILIAVDLSPAPWLDFLGNANVQLQGPLFPLDLDGSFTLDVEDLRVKTGPVHTRSATSILAIPHADALGRIQVKADGLRLDAESIEGPGTRGAADVTIGFGPAGPLDIELDVRRAVLDDFQPLGGVQLGGHGPIRGRLWGPFDALQFSGSGVIDDFSALGFPFADRLVVDHIESGDLKQLELLGARASRGRSTYAGDFRLDFRRPMRLDTDLRLQDGRVRDITSIFVDLPGIRGQMAGDLGIHGVIDNLEADADFRFDNVDLWGERFPAGVGSGTLRDRHFRIGDFLMVRGEQSIEVTGEVGPQFAMDMDVRSKGLTIESSTRAPDVPLTGDVAIDVHVGGSLQSIAPVGTIGLTNLAWQDRRLPAGRIELATRNEVLSVGGALFGEAVALDGQVPLFVDDAQYRLQANLDALPAHLVLPSAADGARFTASASGTVVALGALDTPWPPQSLSVDLPDIDVKWGDLHLTNPRPWRYQQYGERWSIERLAIEGGRTSFGLVGTGGNEVALEGNGTVELDLARFFVPGLTRADGVATVRTRTRGSGSDVRNQIDLDIRASLLRLDSLPVALDGLTAEVTVTDDRITLSSINAGVGGGRLEAKGRIAAESFIPNRWQIDATVNDASVRWIDSLPPAIGNATLHFTGPSDALLLDGSVEIEEMVFADRIDWQDQVLDFREQIQVDPNATPEEGLFALDVGIRADRTIRLQNNLAEGTASADLRLAGTSSEPNLQGQVTVDDAVVFLQDREFRVERGILDWRDPSTWDPEVDFELTTDINSREERYRVNYQVYGPFSDWRTSTRSDPPLPQADVNALLWFGVTTEDLEQSGELPSAVAQGVADLLLADLFASNAASELGEVPDLLFDRIDVATGVNGRGEYSAEPRLVVQKRLDDLGDVDLTWEFNLGRPEDNYVRIDKRIGGVWSIAGWYATLQRDRVLPIGGAYGVDVSARVEID